MSTITRTTTVLLSVVVLYAEFNSVAGEELGRELVQQHTSSLAAITTLTADVEFVSASGVLVLGGVDQPSRRDSSPQSGKFWKSADRIRIDELKSLFGKRTIHFNLHDNSSSLAVPTTQQDGTGWGQIDGSRGVDTVFDAWSKGVCLPLRTDDFKRSHIPLADALSDPRCKRLTTAREDVDGHLCHRLSFEIDSGDNRCDVWLDPGVNHLARKMRNVVKTTSGSRVTVEVIVESFCEPAPGVYFPERVSRSVNGGPKGVLHLSNVRVNKPIPTSTFDVKFSPGTVVSDRVLGKTFTVSANGKPDKPLGQFIQPDESSRPPAGVPTAATPADADDPAWPLWKIILIVAVALGLVGVGIRLVSRWRARRSST